MQEVHEGSFGTHASGHTMARKILRVGYYWLTLEHDCFNHVVVCYKSQVYADRVRVPPVPLNVLTSPWPFAMWGIDMIGEIKPTALTDIVSSSLLLTTSPSGLKLLLIQMSPSK